MMSIAYYVSYSIAATVHRPSPIVHRLAQPFGYTSVITNGDVQTLAY